jgi:hypothetical protein
MQRKEDPCVSAFEFCLQQKYSASNVRRVENGSPVPKWQVWTGNAEAVLTLTFTDRWPASLKPLPMAIEISPETGEKRQVTLPRPSWLAKLESMKSESGMLLCNVTLLCACTGFLPELYGEVRLPQFPQRRIMLHINGGGQDFKHFLARIATRAASRGPREDIARIYAGEMSTNPS